MADWTSLRVQQESAIPLLQKSKFGFQDFLPGFKQPAHRNLRVSEGVKNLLR
jgi:hypothetical protein